MLAFNMFALITVGVGLNALAQILLKQGMVKIGYFEYTSSNIMPILMQISTNPFVCLGLLCYIVSVIVWLMVLSRVDVSLAYPLLSMGYIVTALAGYYLFNENLTSIRLLGIFIIILGVYLITRTAN